MESLLLEIGDTIGLGSLELKFTQYSSYEGISFYLAEYPDYAKYEMQMPVLSRGGSYSTRYTVAPQVVSFSEYNKSIYGTAHLIGDCPYCSVEFCTLHLFLILCHSVLVL